MFSAMYKVKQKHVVSCLCLSIFHMHLINIQSYGQIYIISLQRHKYPQANIQGSAYQLLNQLINAQTNKCDYFNACKSVGESKDGRREMNP